MSAVEAKLFASGAWSAGMTSLPALLRGFDRLEIVGRDLAIGGRADLPDRVPARPHQAAPDPVHGDAGAADQPGEFAVPEVSARHVVCKLHAILYAARTNRVNIIVHNPLYSCAKIVHGVYMVV